MTVFYAAVDGDPLTSHPDSHVMAREGPQCALVAGADGKTRSLVYIGDRAWCGACQSMGVIVGGAPVTERRRMIDLAGGGRRQAVGEDQVLCQCAMPPRVIATYGKRWRFVEESANKKTDVPVQAVVPPLPRSEPQYERWFYIWDSVTGESIPNRDFIANVGGVRQTGRTDGEGYARIMAGGEQPVEVHIFFSSPRRKLNPGEF